MSWISSAEVELMSSPSCGVVFLGTQLHCMLVSPPPGQLALWSHFPSALTLNEAAAKSHIFIFTQRL